MQNIKGFDIWVIIMLAITTVAGIIHFQSLLILSREYKAGKNNKIANDDAHIKWLTKQGIINKKNVLKSAFFLLLRKVIAKK
jgi:hypothetical protein